MLKILLQQENQNRYLIFTLKESKCSQTHRSVQNTQITGILFPTVRKKKIGLNCTTKFFTDLPTQEILFIYLDLNVTYLL